MSDVEVTDPVDVQILPRQPLTLIPLGDAGAASCEGDSCAI
ncbi:hypothetical protein [Herbiconiux sp.]|nr:hypothetical protein [Herbiconiux sp.]